MDKYIYIYIICTYICNKRRHAYIQLYRLKIVVVSVLMLRYWAPSDVLAQTFVYSMCGLVNRLTTKSSATSKAQCSHLCASRLQSQHLVNGIVQPTERSFMKGEHCVDPVMDLIGFSTRWHETHGCCGSRSFSTVRDWKFCAWTVALEFQTAHLLQRCTRLGSRKHQSTGL